jgi:hypothetical protein
MAFPFEKQGCLDFAEMLGSTAREVFGLEQIQKVCQCGIVLVLELPIFNSESELG